MKKILFIVFMLLAVVSNSQVIFGYHDNLLRAKDSLIVDNDFMKSADTIVFLTDVTYHEFSVDGISWSKNPSASDKWMRVSSDAKFNWKILSLEGLDMYWLNDDGVTYTNPVYGDTVVIGGLDAEGFVLNVNGNTNSDYYFIGGDSLKLTNIYNGGGTDGQYLVLSGDTAIWQNLPSGFGETNFGRNVNTRGYGVYEGKTDTVLDFRGIASLTDLLTVNLASEDSTIDLDLALKTITAGTGLTGGGSMEDDVLLNLSVPSLPTFPYEVDGSSDWLILYDVSEGTHYKMHADDIEFRVTDLTWLRNPSYGIMESSTGTGDTIPAVDETYAGLMLPGDKSNLDDITVITLSDGLKTGGSVVWTSGLSFDVTPALYYITGERYESGYDSVTLSAADATYSRIDVIALDTLEQAVVIEGTPSANPQKPSVDPTAYVELTYVLVQANATEPSNPGTGDSITNVVVYDENVEWTTGASGVLADFEATTEVYKGTYSIQVVNIENNDYLSFSSTAVNVGDVETLSAAINMNEPLLKQHGMYASFWLNGVQVSNEIRFLGYYPGTWEIIALSLSEFQFTATQFNEVRLRWSKSGAQTAYSGFYLDWITLQGGISQPAPTEFQTLATDGTPGNVSISNGNSIPINVNDADADSTNELQTIDTLEIVDNILRLSLSNDGEPVKTVGLASYLDNTDDQTASEVDITDVGGYYSSFTVEGALQEIGADLSIAPIDTVYYGNDTLTVITNAGSLVEADTFNVRIALPGSAGWDYSVQTLTSGTDTLDVDLGINAEISLTANTAINVQNLEAGMSGNITVTCSVNGYTLRFTGVTVKTSPYITATSGIITTSAISGAVDVYSWYWDGSYFIINGTQAYN